MANITKSNLALIIIGLLVFIISLLVNMPANVVIPNKIQGITLHGVNGSIWNGSVAQLSQNNRALPAHQLQWKLSALSLLTGSLSIQLTQRDAPSHHATIHYGLASDKLQVSNLSWQLPAETIQPLLPTIATQVGIKPQGFFHISLEQLHLEKATAAPGNTLPIPIKLKGNIQWQEAIINTPTESLILGAPSVDLSRDNNQLIGLLKNNHPSLQTQNSQAHCAPNTRRCELQIDLLTNSDTSTSITSSLSLLGLTNTNNRWRGKLSFSL